MPWMTEPKRDPILKEKSIIDPFKPQDNQQDEDYLGNAASFLALDRVTNYLSGLRDDEQIKDKNGNIVVRKRHLFPMSEGDEEFISVPPDVIDRIANEVAQRGVLPDLDSVDTVELEKRAAEYLKQQAVPLQHSDRIVLRDNSEIEVKELLEEEKGDETDSPFYEPTAFDRMAGLGASALSAVGDVIQPVVNAYGTVRDVLWEPAFSEYTKAAIARMAAERAANVQAEEAASPGGPLSDILRSAFLRVENNILSLAKLIAPSYAVDPLIDANIKAAEYIWNDGKVKLTLAEQIKNKNHNWFRSAVDSLSDIAFSVFLMGAATGAGVAHRSISGTAKAATSAATTATGKSAIKRAIGNGIKMLLEPSEKTSDALKFFTFMYPQAATVYNTQYLMYKDYGLSDEQASTAAAHQTVTEMVIPLIFSAFAPGIEPAIKSSILNKGINAYLKAGAKEAVSIMEKDIRRAISRVGTGAFAAKMFSTIAEEIPEEMLTTLFQQYQESLDIKGKYPSKKELKEGAIDTFLATLLTAGIAGSVPAGIESLEARQKIMADFAERISQNIVVNADFMSRLGDVLQGRPGQTMSGTLAQLMPVGAEPPAPETTSNVYEYTIGTEQSPYRYIISAKSEEFADSEGRNNIRKMVLSAYNNLSRKARQGNDAAEQIANKMKPLIDEGKFADAYELIKGNVNVEGRFTDIPGEDTSVATIYKKKGGIQTYTSALHETVHLAMKKFMTDQEIDVLREATGQTDKNVPLDEDAVINGFFDYLMTEAGVQKFGNKADKIYRSLSKKIGSVLSSQFKNELSAYESINRGEVFTRPAKSIEGQKNTDVLKMLEFFDDDQKLQEHLAGIFKERVKQAILEKGIAGQPVNEQVLDSFVRKVADPVIVAFKALETPENRAAFANIILNPPKLPDVKQFTPKRFVDESIDTFVNSLSQENETTGWGETVRPAYSEIPEDAYFDEENERLIKRIKRLAKEKNYRQNIEKAVERARIALEEFTGEEIPASDLQKIKSLENRIYNRKQKIEPDQKYRKNIREEVVAGVREEFREQLKSIANALEEFGRPVEKNTDRVEYIREILDYHKKAKSKSAHKVISLASKGADYYLSDDDIIQALLDIRFQRGTVFRDYKLSDFERKTFIDDIVKAKESEYSSESVDFVYRLIKNKKQEYISNKMLKNAAKEVADIVSKHITPKQWKEWYFIVKAHLDKLESDRVPPIVKKINTEIAKIAIRNDWPIVDLNRNGLTAVKLPSGWYVFRSIPGAKSDPKLQKEAVKFIGLSADVLKAMSEGDNETVWEKAENNRPEPEPETPEPETPEPETPGGGGGDTINQGGDRTNKGNSPGKKRKKKKPADTVRSIVIDPPIKDAMDVCDEVIYVLESKEGESRRNVSGELIEKLDNVLSDASKHVAGLVRKYLNVAYIDEDLYERIPVGITALFSIGANKFNSDSVDEVLSQKYMTIMAILDSHVEDKNLKDQISLLISKMFSLLKRSSFRSRLFDSVILSLRDIGRNVAMLAAYHDLADGFDPDFSIDIDDPNSILNRIEYMATYSISDMWPEYRLTREGVLSRIKNEVPVFSLASVTFDLPSTEYNEQVKEYVRKVKELYEKYDYENTYSGILSSGIFAKVNEDIIRILFNSDRTKELAQKAVDFVLEDAGIYISDELKSILFEEKDDLELVPRKVDPIGEIEEKIIRLDQKVSALSRYIDDIPTADVNIRKKLLNLTLKRDALHVLRMTLQQVEKMNPEEAVGKYINAENIENILNAKKKFLELTEKFNEFRAKAFSEWVKFTSGYKSHPDTSYRPSDLTFLMYQMFSDGLNSIDMYPERSGFGLYMPLLVSIEKTSPHIDIDALIEKGKLIELVVDVVSSDPEKYRDMFKSSGQIDYTLGLDIVDTLLHSDEKYVDVYKFSNRDFGERIVDIIKALQSDMLSSAGATNAGNITNIDAEITQNITPDHIKTIKSQLKLDDVEGKHIANRLRSFISNIVFELAVVSESIESKNIDPEDLSAADLDEIIVENFLYKHLNAYTPYNRDGYHFRISNVWDVGEIITDGAVETIPGIWYIGLYNPQEGVYHIFKEFSKPVSKLYNLYSFELKRLLLKNNIDKLVKRIDSAAEKGDVKESEIETLESQTEAIRNTLFKIASMIARKESGVVVDPAILEKEKPETKEPTEEELKEAESPFPQKRRRGVTSEELYLMALDATMELEPFLVADALGLFFGVGFISGPYNYIVREEYKDTYKEILLSRKFRSIMTDFAQNLGVLGEDYVERNFDKDAFDILLDRGIIKENPSVDHYLAPGILKLSVSPGEKVYALDPAVLNTLLTFKVGGNPLVRVDIRELFRTNTPIGYMVGKKVDAVLSSEEEESISEFIPEKGKEEKESKPGKDIPIDRVINRIMAQLFVRPDIEERSEQRRLSPGTEAYQKASETAKKIAKAFDSVSDEARETLVKAVLDYMRVSEGKVYLGIEKQEAKKKFVLSSFMRFPSALRQKIENIVNQEKKSSHDKIIEISGLIYDSEYSEKQEYSLTFPEGIDQSSNFFHEKFGWPVIKEIKSTDLKPIKNHNDEVVAYSYEINDNTAIAMNAYFDHKGNLIGFYPAELKESLELLFEKYSGVMKEIDRDNLLKTWYIPDIFDTEGYDNTTRMTGIGTMLTIGHEYLDLLLTSYLAGYKPDFFMDLAEKKYGVQKEDRTPFTFFQALYTLDEKTKRKFISDVANIDLNDPKIKKLLYKERNGKLVPSSASMFVKSLKEYKGYIDEIEKLEAKTDRTDVEEKKLNDLYYKVGKYMYFDNRKAGFSVYYGISTCMPTVGCRTCYATAKPLSSPLQAKNLTNTFITYYSPKATGKALAKLIEIAGRKVIKQLADSKDSDLLPQDFVMAQLVYPFVRWNSQGDSLYPFMRNQLMSFLDNLRDGYSVHVFSRSAHARVKGTKGLADLPSFKLVYDEATGKFDLKNSSFVFKEGSLDEGLVRQLSRNLTDPRQLQRMHEYGIINSYLYTGTNDDNRIIDWMIRNRIPFVIHSAVSADEKVAGLRSVLGKLDITPDSLYTMCSCAVDQVPNQRNCASCFYTGTSACFLGRRMFGIQYDPTDPGNPKKQRIVLIGTLSPDGTFNRWSNEELELKNIIPAEFIGINTLSFEPTKKMLAIAAKFYEIANNVAEKGKFDFPAYDIIDSKEESKKKTGDKKKQPPEKEIRVPNPFMKFMYVQSPDHEVTRNTAIAMRDLARSLYNYTRHVLYEEDAQKLQDAIERHESKAQVGEYGKKAILIHKYLFGNNEKVKLFLENYPFDAFVSKALVDYVLRRDISIEKKIDVMYHTALFYGKVYSAISLQKRGQDIYATKLGNVLYKPEGWKKTRFFEKSNKAISELSGIADALIETPYLPEEIKQSVKNIMDALKRKEDIRNSIEYSVSFDDVDLNRLLDVTSEFFGGDPYMASVGAYINSDIKMADDFRFLGELIEYSASGGKKKKTGKEAGNKKEKTKTKDESKPEKGTRNPESSLPYIGKHIKKLYLIIKGTAEENKGIHQTSGAFGEDDPDVIDRMSLIQAKTKKRWGAVIGNAAAIGRTNPNAAREILARFDPVNSIIPTLERPLSAEETIIARAGITSLASDDIRKNGRISKDVANLIIRYRVAGSAASASMLARRSLSYEPSIPTTDPLETFVDTVIEAVHTDEEVKAIREEYEKKLLDLESIVSDLSVKYENAKRYSKGLSTQIRNLKDQIKEMESQIQAFGELDEKNRKQVESLKEEMTKEVKRLEEELADQKLLMKKISEEYEDEIKTIKRRVAGYKGQMTKQRARAERAEGLLERYRAAYAEFRRIEKELTDAMSRASNNIMEYLESSGAIKKNFLKRYNEMTQRIAEIVEDGIAKVLANTPRVDDADSDIAGSMYGQYLVSDISYDVAMDEQKKDGLDPEKTIEIIAEAISEIVKNRNIKGVSSKISAIFTAVNSSLMFSEPALQLVKATWDINKKFIRSEQSLSDKIFRFYVGSLMTSPLMLARNFVGNLTSGTFDVFIKKPVSVMISHLVGVLTKDPKWQSQELSDYLDMMRESYPAVRDAVQAFMFTMKYGFPVYSFMHIHGLSEDVLKNPEMIHMLDYEDLFSKSESEKDFAKDLFLAPIRATKNLGTFFMLAAVATDEAFKAFYHRLYFSSHLKQAFREEIKKDNLEPKTIMDLFAVASESAWRDAEELTYTNPLPPVAQKIYDLSRLVPGLRYILPFMKTGLNLLWYGGRRFPIFSAIRAYKTVKNPNATPVQKADAMAWLLISTGITAAILALISGEEDDESDYITGTTVLKTMSREESELRRVINPPSAVKIGSKFVSYRELDPISAVVTNSIDTAIALKRVAKGIASDSPSAILSAVTTYMAKIIDGSLNRSYFDTLNSAYESLVNNKKLAVLPANIVSGFIPTFARNIVSQLDPNIRANVTGDFISPIYRRMAPQMLPERRYALGSVMKRPEFFGVSQIDFFIRLLNPFYITTPPTGLERRIYERTLGYVNRYKEDPEFVPPQYIVLPSSIGKHKGKQYELNAVAYERFLTEYARQIRSNMNMVRNALLTRNDHDFVKMMNSISAKSREKAKQKLDRLLQKFSD